MLAALRGCSRRIAALAILAAAPGSLLSWQASASTSDAGKVEAGKVIDTAKEIEPPPPTQRTLWSEHFTGPVDWGDPQGHDATELARVYNVQRTQGASFLHAHHDASQKSPPAAFHFGKTFGKKAGIPLEKVRAFRWRWRAHAQPAVQGDPWEDMALGIYVVTRTPSLFSSGRGFKFGWLAKPGRAGTHQRGLLQVPVRSDAPSDEWKTETVDLCALYRREFGDCEGERILYIGVVTDADGTKSVADGDYTDFELLGDP
ncbi:MAG TPA: hypothetical protein VJT73_06070 [Polyangiaceae bacterium]|nr:hypothetical protein [Polyangiaceae bacterium]